MDSKIGGTLKNNIDPSLFLSHELENKLNIRDVKVAISKDLFDFTEEDFNIPNVSNFRNEINSGNKSNGEMRLCQCKFESIENNINSNNRKGYFDTDINTDEIIKMFAELKITESENAQDIKDLKEIMEFRKQNKSKIKNKEFKREDKVLKKGKKAQKEENKELENEKNILKVENKEIKNESVSNVENKEIVKGSETSKIENKEMVKIRKASKIENNVLVEKIEVSKIEMNLTKENEVPKIRNKESENNEKLQVGREESVNENEEFKIENKKHEDNRELQPGNQELKEESKVIKTETEDFKKESELKTEDEISNNLLKLENDLLNEEDKNFICEKEVLKKYNKVKHNGKSPKLRERAPVPSSRLNRVHLINQNYVTKNNSDAYAERLRFLSGCSVTQVHNPLQFQLENNPSFNAVPEITLEHENSFHNVSGTSFTHEENDTALIVNSPESGYETSLSLPNSPPKLSMPLNDSDLFLNDIDEDALLNCLVEWQFESPSKVKYNVDDKNYKEKLLDFFENLDLTQNESLNLFSDKVINQENDFTCALSNVNSNCMPTPLPLSFNNEFLPELPASDNINIDKKGEPPSSLVTECLSELAGKNLPQFSSKYRPESLLFNNEFVSDLTVPLFSNTNSEFIPDLPIPLFSDISSETMSLLSKSMSNPSCSTLNNCNVSEFSNSASSIFDFENVTDLPGPTSSAISGDNVPNVIVVNLNADLSERTSLSNFEGSPQLPIKCKPLKNTKKDEFRRCLSKAKFHLAQSEIYRRIQEAELRDEEVKIIYIPDENSKTCENQTNLHLAVINNKIEEIYCIVEVQKQWKLPFSDFSLRDKHGKTPLDYAIKKKMDLVAYYLRENNACCGINM